MTRTPDPGAGTHVWTTDAVARTARVAAWRDHLSGMVLPLRVESVHEEDFHGRLTMASLGPLTFLEVRSRAQWLHWDTAEIAASAGEWMFVGAMTKGEGWLHTVAGVEEVCEGGVTFTDSTQPCSLEFRDDFAFATGLLPRADLMDLCPLLPQAHGAALRPPAGAAVAAYLESLAATAADDGTPGSTRPANENQLFDSFVGLVMADLESTVRDRAKAGDDTVLLGRIKRHLITTLTQGGPTTEEVAESFGLSERRVQRLFRTDGTTLTSWLLHQRLQRCRRDLRNPAYVDWPVAEIAARWGFDDPAYFSRRFRDAYGSTPGEYQQRHAAQGYP